MSDKTRQSALQASGMGKRRVVIPGVVAMGMTGAWIALCLAYIARISGLHDVMALPPYEMGSFLTGIFGVPALVWFVLLFWLRVRSAMADTRLAPAMVTRSELMRVAAETAAVIDASRHGFESLQGAVAALSSGAAGLESRSATLVTHLTSSEAQFGETTKLLQTAMEGMETAQGRLGTGLQTAREQIHGAVAQFEKVSGDLSNRVETASGRLGEIATRAESGKVQIEILNNALARMKEIEARFAETSGRLRDIEGDLGGRVTTIQHGTEAFARIVGSSGETLKALMGEYDRAGERLTLSARGFATLGTESRSAIEHAAERWQATGQVIAAQAEALIQQSSAAHEKIQDATDRLAVKTGEINGLLDQSSHRMEHVSGTMSSLADRLPHLDATTTSIASRFDEANDRICSYAGHIGVLGERLHEARAAIDRSAEGARDAAEDIINRSASALDTTAHLASEWRSAAAGLSNAVDVSQGRLDEGLATFRALRQEIEQSAQVIGGFVEQAPEMGKAASETAIRLEDAARRIQQYLDGSSEVTRRLEDVDEALRGTARHAHATGAEMAMRVTEATQAIQGAVAQWQDAGNHLSEQARHFTAGTDEAHGRLSRHYRDADHAMGTGRGYDAPRRRQPR